MTKPTPARAARQAAGLTLEQAAKLARIKPAYLRDCERTGQFSYVLAERLSRILQCRMEAFLPPTGRQPENRQVRKGRVKRDTRPGWGRRTKPTTKAA